MSDEKYSEMVMALGKVANALLKNAGQTQMSANEAIRNVQVAGDEYRDLATSLPTRVKSAINEALSGAADAAAERLTSKFTQADAKAKIAADRYEEAARSLGLKAIAIIIVAWIVSLGVVTGMIWFLTEKNTSLQNDRRVLDAVMVYLKQNNSQANIGICGDTQAHHVCAWTGKAWENLPMAGLSAEQWER